MKTLNKFKSWLSDDDRLSTRYILDTVSRIKTLEREARISIEDEYRKDSCQHLLSLLKDYGKGLSLVEHGRLPILKKGICTYASAVRRYVEYRNFEERLSCGIANSKPSQCVCVSEERGEYMDYDSFRSWLEGCNNHLSKRYIQDIVSRIKTIERETNISLEQEYLNDHCQRLLSMFKKYGSGFSSIEHGCLPVGKKSIINYSGALHKYIKFMDDSNR